MTSEMEKLRNEILAMRHEQKQKDEAREKARQYKKNRVGEKPSVFLLRVKKTKFFCPRTRKIKNAITFQDLLGVMDETRNIASKDNVAASRDRVCILLLYIFGIRVAELRELTVQQIYEFLERKPIEITMGKSTSRIKHTLVSSEESRKLITKYVLDDLEKVRQVYGQGAYLVSLSREHLTRRMNSFFRAYGAKVNKTLLSHSCRIAFVTRIVEKFGIEAARQMVGHQHISTTQGYSRTTMSPRFRSRLMNETLKSSVKGTSKAEDIGTEEAASQLLDEMDSELSGSNITSADDE